MIRSRRPPGRMVRPATMLLLLLLLMAMVRERGEVRRRELKTSRIRLLWSLEVKVLMADRPVWPGRQRVVLWEWNMGELRLAPGCGRRRRQGLRERSYEEESVRSLRSR